MTPVETITHFYSAFASLDAESMLEAYHPDVTFEDPAFGRLDAPQARAMWRMLCKRAKDFSLEFSDVQAESSAGQAHWEAHYTFSATGRTVHNVIDARFKFADDKIIEHVDSFDLAKWSRQALGLPGLLLGWSGFLQNKIRAQAKSGLQAYLAKYPEAGAPV